MLKITVSWKNQKILKTISAILQVGSFSLLIRNIYQLRRIPEARDPQTVGQAPADDQSAVL